MRPMPSHLFFGNGLGDSFFNLMATHPPIPDRIHAIDPTWDGKFQAALDADSVETFQRAAAGIWYNAPADAGPSGEILGGAVIASGGTGQPPVIQPQSVLPNLGNPTPLHLKYAEAVARRAAGKFQGRRARSARRDRADLCVAFESTTIPCAPTQLAGLASRVAETVSEQTAALFPEVSAAGNPRAAAAGQSRLRALRHLTPDQFKQFSQTLAWLIGSDGKVELFEFVLQKIVRRHLAPQFGDARNATVQFYTLKPLVPDCAVVLSALAHVGSDEPEEIQKAFDAGAPFVYAPDGSLLALLPLGPVRHRTT